MLEDIDGGVGAEVVGEFLELVGVVVVLPVTLGPGFGDPLLLHAATAVTNSATITAATTRNFCTRHLADQG